MKVHYLIGKKKKKKKKLCLLSMISGVPQFFSSIFPIFTFRTCACLTSLCNNELLAYNIFSTRAIITTMEGENEYHLTKNYQINR
jgi:hypothetical protein